MSTNFGDTALSVSREVSEIDKEAVAFSVKNQLVNDGYVDSGDGGIGTVRISTALANFIHFNITYNGDVRIGTVAFPEFQALNFNETINSKAATAIVTQFKSDVSI